MNFDTFSTSINQSLTAYMVLTLPPLLAALVVGLVIGLLQAVTQIQDQSLPQILKILTVSAVLVLAAPILVAPLLTLTQTVFTTFPLTTR
jgi:type III secretion protein S